MPKALQQWTVLPHGSLTKLSPKIMTVTGDMQMPLTRLERRMTLVRLSDDRLIVYNAVALDEAGMREVERFGRPTFLVVPNHMHRHDAVIWKGRYRSLSVVTAPGARKAVEEVLPVDTTAPDFGDASVRLVSVAGTGERECALEVQDDDGLSLILTDVIGNLPRDHGVVLRVLGFAGVQPRIPRAVRAGMIKDKTKLKAQLTEWGRANVKRVLVGHGRPIETDPSAVLLSLASSL